MVPAETGTPAVVNNNKISITIGIRRLLTSFSKFNENERVAFMCKSNIPPVWAQADLHKEVHAMVQASGEKYQYGFIAADASVTD